MPTFTILKPPTTGTAITQEGRPPRRSRRSDHSVHRRRRHRAGHLARQRARVRCRREKAYGGKRKIAWFEVFAGEKSFKQFDNWLPDDTVEAFRHYLVGIKGPLTTPVGGGIRSLNVALRQMLDLFVCLRPVRWYKGVPSPVKHPEKVDMVIFRENTEDIYAGIEYAAGTPEAQKVLDFFAREFPKEFKKIRFGTAQAAKDWQAQLEGIGAPTRDVGVQVGVGLKPISYLGTERLVHSAISYAIANKRKSVTLVHKGNIMKFTEGAFRDWGYEVAKTVLRRRGDRRRAVVPDPGRQAGRRHRHQGCDRRHHAAAGPDAARRVRRHRDAESERRLPVRRAAAQVGGIGIAPGGNINYVTGHAVFEATHGTAPKYADQDKVNPGSVDPVGRDDAAPPRLGRSGRPDRQGHGRRHRGEAGHLRLRAADGRRHRAQDVGVRRRDDREHVSRIDAAAVREQAMSSIGDASIVRSKLRSHES